MSHFKFQDCRDELSVYIWYSRRHEHYWSFRGCFSRLACRWVVPPDHLLLRKPRGPWELQGKWPRSKTDWLRLSMEACSKKTCTQNALFSNMPQMGQTFVSVSFNCPQSCWKRRDSQAHWCTPCRPGGPAFLHLCGCLTQCWWTVEGRTQLRGKPR